MTFEDGGIYVGEWKDGQRHGHGTYTWTWGDRCIGEWKEDVADGQCVHIYADGGRYEGQMRSGMRNGSGVFAYAHGDVLHAEYCDDMKQYGQWLHHDGSLSAIRRVHRPSRPS